MDDAETSEERSKGGKPKPLQLTDSLTLTLPQTALGYLRFLATNTILGATPQAVASLILTNELNRMAQAEMHRIAVPRS